MLGFYLIQNGSRAALLSVNPNNDAPRFGSVATPVAFFSFDAANPDGVRHVQVVADRLTGTVEYRWEDLFGGGDLDYNDAVITVQPNASGGVQPTLETLRLPAGANATVATTFQLRAGQQSPAVASPRAAITTLPGEFGVIPVSNAQGTIGGLSPSDAGWLAAALGARQQVFASGAALGASTTLNLTGSQHYLFYAISSGTAASLLASNATNATSGASVAFFSVDAANPDDVEHFRWFGPEQVDQATSGAGTANDDLRLHVMDAVFGGEADFDRYVVGINF